jgi:DNA-directed RNA polymerase subunit RPC12/RpoP
MTLPKHGQPPRCADCNSVVSHRRSIRCKNCSMKLRALTKERLLAGATPDDNGCWIWQRAFKSADGRRTVQYGWVTYQGRQMGAHRAVWIALNGQIPDGLCVCHTCDVPSCVNPDHLFLGTHADNMRDMAQKGRRRQPAIDARAAQEIRT